MQKIILKDNTEILNVQELTTDIEHINKDEREILQVIINITENNTVNYINSLFNTDNAENFSSIKVFLIENDTPIFQSTQIGYNILHAIERNLTNNTLKIILARDSKLERAILDTHLALAEIGLQLQGGEQ